MSKRKLRLKSLNLVCLEPLKTIWRKKRVALHWKALLKNHWDYTQWHLSLLAFYLKKASLGILLFLQRLVYAMLRDDVYEYATEHWLKTVSFPRHWCCYRSTRVGVTSVTLKMQNVSCRKGGIAKLKRRLQWSILLLNYHLDTEDVPVWAEGLPKLK